ncbi:MAG: HEAT repeat domain-containing protein [Verrucomicrobiota bacterium]
MAKSYAKILLCALLLLCIGCVSERTRLSRLSADDSPEATTKIIPFLTSHRQDLALGAALQLGYRSQQPVALEALLSGASAANAVTRKAALQGFGSLDIGTALPIFVNAMTDPDSSVRQTLPPLLQRLVVTNRTWVVLQTNEAHGFFGPGITQDQATEFKTDSEKLKRVEPLLNRLARDESERVRAAALHSLASLGDDALLDIVMGSAMTDNSVFVRAEAIQALAAVLRETSFHKQYSLNVVEVNEQTFSSMKQRINGFVTKCWFGGMLYQPVKESTEKRIVSLLISIAGQDNSIDTYTLKDRTRLGFKKNLHLHRSIPALAVASAGCATQLNMPELQEFLKACLGSSDVEVQMAARDALERKEHFAKQVIPVRYVKRQ